ncbi:MFS transporter family glucose-6-phosphate receptor UhpC [Photobacterium damselae subsp. damselae]|uniref:MFS transporter family glucose-6-phosphate receptor UhpC n=1 Tax=Photobacterium damselae TaxID=38293 RepID=UPI00311B2D14
MTDIGLNTVPENKIDQTYKKWRIQILIGMYVGYTAYYFTRKSLNFIAPTLLDSLILDKETLGLMGTLFYIVYGLSKFFSGIISDKSNPRWFMGGGLIITGLVNIVFGLSSSTALFIALWVVNAYFQGWGWAPCSKLLTSWYSKSERGAWWSIQNTSHNLGGALIPIIVGVITLHYGWRSGMIIPGCIAIVCGLFVCWRLRDKPETMGLPTVGQWRNDPLELQQEKASVKGDTKTIIINYILKNKAIWLLALAYIMVYIVRTSINDWSNIYLTEARGFDILSANSTISFFEIGGFIGSLFAGWGSDFFFKGRRGPINVIFSIGVVVTMFCLWNFNSASYYTYSIIYFLSGFFIFGPQMLIGIMAAESSHKDAAGAAVGFVSLFGYIGAALSGYPVAKVIENYQWQGFFTLILATAILASLFLMPFLFSKKKV